MTPKSQANEGGAKALSLEDALDLLRKFVQKLTEQVLDEQGLTLLYAAALELLEKDWRDEVRIQKEAHLHPGSVLVDRYRKLAASVSEKLPFLFKIDDLVQDGRQKASSPYREDEFRQLMSFVTKWLSSLKADPVVWSPSVLAIRENFGLKAQVQAAVDLARKEGIEVPLS